MDDGTTYDVRVYRTEVYKGARVTTYKVRWKTGHRLWEEGFRNAALADSFRSSLLTAARKGEAFSLCTGLPRSWKDNESTLTWYALTLDYTAAKWPYAAPNHRKSIAEALTDATEAMLTRDEPPYPAADIRRALRTWAFSDRLRGATEPPADLAAVVRWLRSATIPVADLNRPGTGASRCRALLDRVSRKQDGTAAAANTANRKRAALNNLMQYAIEVGALSANPLKAVKWTRPRTLKTVDPRTVVNSDQVRRLLAAVGQQGQRGERMVAFFGCMYYAALRPEEAVELRPDNLASLPDHGWGELILTTPSRAAAPGGPIAARPGSAASSSTVRTARPARCRSIPSWSRSSVSMSRSTGLARTGASSPAHAAASSTTGPTSRSSTRPAPQPSPARKRRLCWPGAPTTCGTLRSPPGSTPECPRRRLLSGLVTASMFCCGSTPGVSTASNTKPSAASRKPPGPGTTIR